VLERKLQFVALWMHNIEQEEEAKKIAFRQLGAVRQIIAAFRIHRMRSFLKRLVFWRKMEVVMNIQRRYRGYIQRKKYRQMQAEMRRKERKRNDGALRIQTAYRRHAKRCPYVQHLQVKAAAKAARYEAKKRLLEKVDTAHF
jgi:hypothetical protein